MSKRIEIRCPVYGFIPLDSWEHDIIETPEFQRLRRIRQLAWTDYVYPGAMHTRFEHTLGVAHMAGLLFDQLTRENSASRKLIIEHLGGNAHHLPRFRRIVRLAALLHDIGHSPFSHAAEELFPLRDEEPSVRFEHEDYSAEIIKLKFSDVIDHHKDNAYGITAEEVADLIAVDADAGRNVFWRPLISGQLDADRMDYLLRDSHHAGVQYGRYDWHRIVNTITVAPPEPHRAPRLGVTEGGWHAAEGLILARYMMFSQVYFHKTRAILDIHLKYALKEMLPSGQFPPPTHEMLDEYLMWDDWRVLGKLAEGGGGEHGERLRSRNFFREVKHSAPYPDKSSDKVLTRWRRALSGFSLVEVSSVKSWYKVDDTDIPVVAEDGSSAVHPLSSYSPIVRRMERMRMIRLYVPPECRYEAFEKLEKNQGRGR